MTSTASPSRLRHLQDRWLALSFVQAQVRNHGEDERIASGDAPTFRQVREEELPEWEGWFVEFFEHQ